MFRAVKPNFFIFSTNGESRNGQQAAPFSKWRRGSPGGWGHYPQPQKERETEKKWSRSVKAVEWDVARLRKQKKWSKFDKKQKKNETCFRPLDSQSTATITTTASRRPVRRSVNCVFIGPVCACLFVECVVLSVYSAHV